MSSAVSRMQFLRGDFRGKSTVIRPPWALIEESFIARCSRCRKCVDVCPEKVLVKSRGNFPEVDFSRGECSFCAACVEQCSDNALINEGGSSLPWQLKASVEEGCLTLQGVVCVSCKEQCDAGAIQMKHQPGAVATPQIDHALCTGCGACYQPCPANAIAIKAAQTAEERSEDIE